MALACSLTIRCGSAGSTSSTIRPTLSELRPLDQNCCSNSSFLLNLDQIKGTCLVAQRTVSEHVFSLRGNICLQECSVNIPIAVVVTLLSEFSSWLTAGLADRGD